MAMKTLFQPRMATSDDAPRAPSGGVAAGGSDEHQAPPELHLNAEHIKALGWKPKAGARHTIHAEVVVHRVGSENDTARNRAKRKAQGRPRSIPRRCTSTRWKWARAATKQGSRRRIKTLSGRPALRPRWIRRLRARKAECMPAAANPRILKVGARSELLRRVTTAPVDTSSHVGILFARLVTVCRDSGARHPRKF